VRTNNIETTSQITLEVYRINIAANSWLTKKKKKKKIHTSVSRVSRRWRTTRQFEKKNTLPSQSITAVSSAQRLHRSGQRIQHRRVRR
jgi:hypothetical protein